MNDNTTLLRRFYCRFIHGDVPGFRQRLVFGITAFIMENLSLSIDILNLLGHGSIQSSFAYDNTTECFVG
ncbi:hypothetical protein CCR75_009031 [Bremia lactucae]|uniref:Uncharacterized protein n=1 Tax=Bremia lactucae TaxID=4779 RepID=A0A976FIU3_BRELC|nr:hypothetical protein CCR75_009031 [Bremia lactucae]